MINVKDVTKTFGDFKALDGLTLNVKKASVYGLIGPNGAGKTTFIKNLMGIYKPDSGEITVDGEPVYENIEKKKNMVYISDDLYFFPTYSILDTAKYYAGIYPKWNWETFEALKKIFKIDVKRKPKKLSKGMQKQVAFWMGLSAMPKVLILDEPVDGLDPVMRRNVWKIIVQFVAEYETTVLISSHNLRELEDICDHVGIMYEGKVVLEKSLDDIKGNIHKIQLAFDGEFPPEIYEKAEILHKETVGRVHTVIAKGVSDNLEEVFGSFKPLLCDIIPLSLEEVFIYELGGMGYEFENIII